VHIGTAYLFFLKNELLKGSFYLVYRRQNKILYLRTFIYSLHAHTHTRKTYKTNKYCVFFCVIMMYITTIDTHVLVVRACGVFIFIVSYASSIALWK